MLTRNRKRAARKMKVVKSLEVSREIPKPRRTATKLESLAHALDERDQPHMFDMTLLKTNESTNAVLLIAALRTSL